MNAQDFYDYYRRQGFTAQQIADAMCDGDFISGDADLCDDQELVESIHAIAKRNAK